MLVDIPDIPPPAPVAAPLNPAPPIRRGGQRWQWACFLGALLVFAVTRFTALEQYPIYFFCDEAIHSVCAQELIANHFRSPTGEFLPTYFRNFLKFNLSLSVYVQGLSNWLFGQSIWTVRATSAAFGLTSAAALAWMLRSVFRLREWWLGAMLLAVTPVWMLHTRTGFETVLMVSCYGWFLCFYLLYRCRDPRWIFPAMLAGAGTFYAYANGQGVMALSALLLLASDARYHWQKRGWAAAGLGFALILFLPYLRFRHNHPDFLDEHLRDLDSYISQDLPLDGKAFLFARYYLQGLSPRYWFFPGQEVLARHSTPGEGHFFTWLLPFFLIGVGVCLRRWRESPYRALLAAMLAAPFSAALAGINACRALEFVIPANAAIALGLSVAMDRVKTPALILTARLGAFAGLALAGLTLLANCLAFGPTFSADYGLYGMQWGAREVMRDAMPGWLRAHPEAHIRVSGSWSNGVHAFVPFFQLPPDRVSFANIDESSEIWNPVAAKESDLLVIPAYELPELRACMLFGGFELLGHLPYPDGRPGFYLGRLRRAEDWQERMAAWRRKKGELTPTKVRIHGQPVTVLHPEFDLGNAQELFDGDPNTTPRCWAGVPMVIELRFPQPRTLESVTVRHRERTQFRQRVTAFIGEKEVVSPEDKDDAKLNDPAVRVPLGGQALDSNVHLREIELEDAPPAQLADGKKPG
jgi:hypothetical protein